MADRRDIVARLDALLDVEEVEDSSSNGLQVEGVETVTRVALATDAAMATFARAIDLGCEMLLVHHGIIWGGIERVTGATRRRLELLLSSGLNLYAAHLPLDLHPELGNNAVLARIAGLVDTAPFGRYRGRLIGVRGTLPEPIPAADLAERWRAEIGGEPRILPFGPDRVRTVGVVSGGGGSIIGEAVSSGLDCFATGEAEHVLHHEALEGGVSVICLGHYASETVGVRAVGEELERRFGVETVFVDEPTGL